MSTTVVSDKDFSKPIVRRKVLSARNAGTMKTVIDYDEYGAVTTDEPTAHGGTGEGASPLQLVLGALCGCEAVTLNRTASEMDFDYAGIDFDAAFTIDIRGRQGMRQVRPHFQTIKVEATIYTDESDERLKALIEETESRCPVYNLMQDASVKVEAVWIKKSPGQMN